MAGLFGIDDPQKQGLLSAALAMLAASGPSPKRTSVGQVLGLGGMQGLESYNAARVLQQRDEELRRRNAIVDMQMKKMQAEQENEEGATRFMSDPRNLFQINQPQSAVGDYGPGEAPTVGPQETNVGQRNQRDIAMRMVLSGNPLLMKQGWEALNQKSTDKRFLPVGGNAVFDTTTEQFVPNKFAPEKSPTESEAERLIRRINDPSTSPSELPQLRARLEALNYRAPSAVAVQLEGREGAKGRISGLVSTLQQYYDDLDAAGGAVKAGQSPVENAINLGMNSPPGQYLGRALGTQAQIARDGIAAMRPALINEIRQATGMSARAMDSNVELQFNIKMATDPGVDPSVNRAALERIDKAYGLGWGVSSTPEGRNKLNSLNKKDSSSRNPIAPQGGLVRGQEVNGYLYLGGDPNNPSSWAKKP